MASLLFLFLLTMFVVLVLLVTAQVHLLLLMIGNCCLILLPVLVLLMKFTNWLLRIVITLLQWLIRRFPDDVTGFLASDDDDDGNNGDPHDGADDDDNDSEDTEDDNDSEDTEDDNDSEDTEDDNNEDDDNGGNNNEDDNNGNNNGFPLPWFGFDLENEEPDNDELIVENSGDAPEIIRDNVSLANSTSSGSNGADRVRKLKTEHIQNFGDRLLLVINEGETLAQTMVGILEKFQIPHQQIRIAAAEK